MKLQKQRNGQEVVYKLIEKSLLKKINRIFRRQYEDNKGNVFIDARLSEHMLNDFLTRYIISFYDIYEQFEAEYVVCVSLRGLKGLMKKAIKRNKHWFEIPMTNIKDL